MESNQIKLMTLCAANRAALFAKLPAKSMAIVVANSELTRNGDVYHEYRQNSDMLYLSQFTEPESVLVLSNLAGCNEFIMFVRPKDKSKEVWTGKRCGTDNAVKIFGADKACVIDDLTTVLAPMLKTAAQVYYTLGINCTLDEKFKSVWNVVKTPLFDVTKLISELRLFKSSTEIELMRKAAAISGHAHARTMEMTKPSLYEFQLQATIEHDFKYNGGTGLAYGSIVAAGNNACTLHYESNSSKIKNGDLILIDAGCEFHGYASDITRTFPANGKFSLSQKVVYELVLKAQLAAIAMCQTGNSIQSVHDEAAKVMSDGLIELGLIDPKSSKTDAAKLTDFFMHGTSHYLGLDVHDVGSYRNAAKPDETGKNRLLAPGMVITVEPGLYFDNGDKRIPSQYRGIGVRIEDDVLITANGHDVLSKSAPKTVKEIEALMAQH